MNTDRDQIGEALPRYEIGDELGRGAWGVVLAGRHRDLERDVAIKQLPPAFGADPAVRARFRAEARLLASLNHPHIVQIHDFVEHENLCLLVMERLDGGTVWDRFSTEGLTMEESCSVVLAACDALQRAHGLGVLHRDVKPHNLMYANDGMVKVTDFGIAKVLGGAQTVATVAGQVLGTPAYMSPEQARGEELTPATDVYATAAVLYELLSGRLPFVDADSAIVMLHSRAFDDPIPLADVAGDVPDSLVDVVMKGLAREVENRYASAEEFGAAVAGAGNELWDTGWLGSRGLVVLATGGIARALSLPPVEPVGESRETQAVRPSDEAGHVEDVPAPTPRPEDVVPVAEMADTGSDAAATVPPGGAAPPPPPGAMPSESPEPAPATQLAPAAAASTAAPPPGDSFPPVPPGEGDGGQAPPPGGRSGNRGVLVVVGVLAALVVAGLLVFFLTSRGGDEEADNSDDRSDETDESDESDQSDETDDQSDETDEPQGEEFGDEPNPPEAISEFGSDENLDSLAEDCFAADYEACDDLFFDSPEDSNYRLYGDSCAGRQPAGTGLTCVEAAADAGAG